MTLIAELQRRKVFKAGAAYLVVAWLAVQASSIAFPAFDPTPEGMKLDPNPSGRARVLGAAAVLVALAFGAR